jgi:Polysaccharide lyase family 4, domain II
MDARISLTALLLSIGVAVAANAATAAGKVTFAPRRGQTPIAAETIVWLEPAATDRVPHPVPGSYVMTTRSKTLIPHVLAIPVGSTVTFPNDDAVTHNLFSLSPASSFDLGLYRRGTGKSYRFTKPGIVNVYCNVHPSMSAVIEVLSTPYFTMANQAGDWSIANVVPGKYRVVAWNEQAGSAQSEIEIDAGGAMRGNPSPRLESSAERAGHPNKFGEPYPPRTKDY